EHLDQMSYLREGIGLRGYGQKDPLVEYKNEAYGMFTELIANIQKQVVYSIYKMADVRKLAPEPQQLQKQHLHGAKKNMASQSTVQKNGGEVGLPTEALAKVGRNEPCPCGSGKKYKKCHLIGN
ncbi:MAG: Preprotein translocase, SecA subunit, partial [uncultured bacterium]